MLETNTITTMNRLTNNEANNLIYAIIKYGFGNIIPSVKNPPNHLIKDVMLELSSEDINVSSVVNTTLRVVETKFDISVSDTDFERLKKYCFNISAAVMKQPFELRNDLGVDAESDDFVTKH